MSLAPRPRGIFPGRRIGVAPAAIHDADIGVSLSGAYVLEWANVSPLGADRVWTHVEQWNSGAPENTRWYDDDADVGSYLLFSTPRSPSFTLEAGLRSVALNTGYASYTARTVFAMLRSAGYSSVARHNFFGANQSTPPNVQLNAEDAEYDPTPARVDGYPVSGAIVPTVEWSTFAASWRVEGSARRVKIWINGVAAGDRVTSSAYNFGTTPYVIGDYYGYETYSNFRLKRFELYMSHLSDAAVAALHAGCSDRFPGLLP